MARSARCYCGASKLSLTAEPLQVVYCHCDDCRRWTGAAAPVFAAFSDGDVAGLDLIGQPKSFSKGTNRWNCIKCGSPMLGRFDYVPGQSWIPLGVIEDSTGLAPEFHCFADRKHPWMPDAGLPGSEGSGRDVLNAVNNG
ncbi:MAG: GFA family protein [Pseudomonadota bacterium]